MNSQTSWETYPFFKKKLKTADAKDKISITLELMNQFRSLHKTLGTCCQLALRHPISNKNLVLMPDAGFQPAGCAVLIAVDPNQKYTSTWKNYAAVASESKTFIPTEIKCSIPAEKSSGYSFSIKTVWTYLLGLHQTHHYHDWQQISHKIFPNGNFTTTTLECMRFCIAIHFCNSTQTWENENSGRFPIKTWSRPEWKKWSQKYEKI